MPPWLALMFPVLTPGWPHILSLILAATCSYVGGRRGERL